MAGIRKDFKMMVCVLASGSSGNSIYVETPHTKILLDAGLSGKTITGLLESIKTHPSQIDGIVVTHEHSDHVGGVGVLSRKHNIPVFMEKETYITSQPKIGTISGFKPFEPGEPFWIKDMVFEPFSVPHDAVNPVGMLITCDGWKVGVATDLGYSSALVQQKLSGCNILVLESNHNLKMLIDGSYSWPLKQRIMSKSGHLSNRDSLNLLKQIIHPDLQYLYLAHLSEENNRPEIVRNLFNSALKSMNYNHVKMSIALQKELSDVAILR